MQVVRISTMGQVNRFVNMADALYRGNRADLIAPGVICGTLGLAIGTLLGVGVGEILLLFT